MTFNHLFPSKKDQHGGCMEVKMPESSNHYEMQFFAEGISWLMLMF